MEEAEIITVKKAIEQDANLVTFEEETFSDKESAHMRGSFEVTAESAGKLDIGSSMLFSVNAFESQVGSDGTGAGTEAMNRTVSEKSTGGAMPTTMNISGVLPKTDGNSKTMSLSQLMPATAQFGPSSAFTMPNMSGGLASNSNVDGIRYSNTVPNVGKAMGMQLPLSMPPQQQQQQTQMVQPWMQQQQQHQQQQQQQHHRHQQQQAQMMNQAQPWTEQQGLQQQQQQNSWNAPHPPALMTGALPHHARTFGSAQRDVSLYMYESLDVLHYM